MRACMVMALTPIPATMPYRLLGVWLVCYALLIMVSFLRAFYVLRKAPYVQFR